MSGHWSDCETPASRRIELHLLMMGEMEFAKPLIVFSDIASLKATHIEGPALQLGMDVLGKLKGLAIDYPRSELQLKPERETKMASERQRGPAPGRKSLPR